jgi:hypothetical protein
MDYSLALHVWDLRGNYAGVNVDKVEEKSCPSSTLVREAWLHLRSSLKAKTTRGLAAQHVIKDER